MQLWQGSRWTKLRRLLHGARLSQSKQLPWESDRRRFQGNRRQLEGN